MTFATDKASMQADIQSTLALADGHLADLLEITNVTFADAFNIDEIIPDSYNYATVPQVAFPLVGAGFAPSIGVLSDPPPSPPTVSFTTGLTVDVPEFLSSDLIAPTTAFTYDETAYTSILLDPLKTKLLDNLENGGYGIEEDDEIALFNRARDREVEVALTRVEEAGRAMASRGFPLPPGELSIHVDRAYQDMQNKVSAVSRDIMLARSKLYVDNRQFTIREVREIEKILMDFHNAVRERALNFARATVQLSIEIYNTQILRFRARLEAAKILSDVQVESLRGEIEEARINLEGYRAQIVGYEANVRRQIESGRLQVEYYRGATDEARMLNEGSVAKANLQAKVLEATVQQNIQISNMTIANAKAKLEATVSALNFKTASVQYAASNFFAQLTALMSTLNVLTVETTTA